jgi:hypothetical protein
VSAYGHGASETFTEFTLFTKNMTKVENEYDDKKMGRVGEIWKPRRVSYGKPALQGGKYKAKQS